MKKYFKLLLVCLFMLGLSGCSEGSLNTGNTYTTIYPIEYLTSYLYGDDSIVNSIYPHGADVASYELTDRQVENYSKGNLFVYNGLTEEKELAREFLNQNPKLLLIDVSYGLNYEYAIEELWLSPNNFLMLAKNIRNNLIDYTTSTVLVENIEEKYEELEVTLSFMDAELRSVATEARSDGNPTLVVSSSKLAFLKNYGFDVIILDESNNGDAVREAFDEGTYTDFYLCDTDTKTDFINSLESKYDANIIMVDTMYTLTDEEANNNENYLTIMRDFIDHIRNTTLG